MLSWSFCRWFKSFRLQQFIEKIKQTSQPKFWEFTKLAEYNDNLPNYGKTEVILFKSSRKEASVILKLTFGTDCTLKTQWNSGGQCCEAWAI